MPGTPPSGAGRFNAHHGQGKERNFLQSAGMKSVRLRQLNFNRLSGALPHKVSSLEKIKTKALGALVRLALKAEHERTRRPLGN